MHETDLKLEPNEASDLCRVFAPDVLERHGWDRAFVTVLDEAPAEEALALLVHRAGAPLEEGWEALRVHADPLSDGGRTEDAEACAARDGHVYVLGSQFGKKAGPLAARRSWIARASEASLARARGRAGRARDRAAALRPAPGGQRCARRGRDRPAAGAERAGGLRGGDDRAGREEGQAVVGPDHEL